MELKSKVESYLGFAIKAGKLKSGAQLIKTSKNVKLLIVCYTAKKNSLKEAQDLSNRFGVKLIMSNTKSLEEITGKKNCKIVAVQDESLTKAILNNLDKDFSEYKWEA